MLKKAPRNKTAFLVFYCMLPLAPESTKSRSGVRVLIFFYFFIFRFFSSSLPSFLTSLLPFRLSSFFSSSLLFSPPSLLHFIMLPLAAAARLQGQARLAGSRVAQRIPSALRIASVPMVRARAFSLFPKAAYASSTSSEKVPLSSERYPYLKRDPSFKKV